MATNFNWDDFEEVKPQKVQSKNFNWDDFEGVEMSVKTPAQAKPIVKQQQTTTQVQPAPRGYDGQYADILSNNSFTKEQQVEQIKQRGQQELSDIEKERWKGHGRSALGATLLGASAAPVFNIPYIGTGIGGAMADVGQGIIEGEKSDELWRRAARGGAIGLGVGAIPYVGKFAGKTKAGQYVGRKVGEVATKVLENPTIAKTAEILAKTRYLTPKMEAVGRARNISKIRADKEVQQLNNLELKSIPNLLDDITPQRTIEEASQPITTQITDEGTTLINGGGLQATDIVNDVIPQKMYNENIYNESKLLSNVGRRERIADIRAKRADWGIAFQKQSGNPEAAITKLLEQRQGFVPKAFHKEGIGDIDLVWGKGGKFGYGLEHIIEGRVKQGINTDEFLRELPETIRNGVVTKNPKYPSKAYIEDPQKNIVISLDWNGKNRKWIITAFKQNKSASKRLMPSAPLSNITTENGTTSISELVADNNIIANTHLGFNPSLQQSGLQQSVINARGVPTAVKKQLRKNPSKYIPLSNEDLTNEAINSVENNFDNELSRLTQSKDFDALDFEKTRQIARRLFDGGKYEQAINLIDNATENATKKGQAIQALSLWSNMTPEGANYKAAKLLNEYNRRTGKKLKLTNEQSQAIHE